MPRYNLERPKEFIKNRHTVTDLNLGEKYGSKINLSVCFTKLSHH